MLPLVGVSFEVLQAVQLSFVCLRVSYLVAGKLNSALMGAVVQRQKS